MKLRNCIKDSIKRLHSSQLSCNQSTVFQYLLGAFRCFSIWLFFFQSNKTFGLWFDEWCDNISMSLNWIGKMTILIFLSSLSRQEWHRMKLQMNFCCLIRKFSYQNAHHFYFLLMPKVLLRFTTSDCDPRWPAANLSGGSVPRKLGGQEREWWNHPVWM